MRIERIWAQSFRNLSRLSLVAEAPALILRGGNAQGKTNVLEALYLCATGRSFRQTVARGWVQHGAAMARLEATFARNEVRHDIALQYAQEPLSRPRVRLDGRTLSQLSQLLQLINVVAFFPEDLGIIKGGPEPRRRFFDRAVASGRPSFVAASAAYARALKQRNALLRQPTPPTAALLAPYDALLLHNGAEIWQARQAALEELAPAARALFAQLMPHHRLKLYLGSGIPALDNAPQHPLPDAAAFRTAFAEALKGGVARDRARGMTLGGPHRGDLLCSLDGHDARNFASQGQQRALILALKMAELSVCQRRLGTAPILLLDDVSSELDSERLAALFAVVAQLGCQVWVTTTGSVDLPLQTDRQTFAVEGGQVRPTDD